MFLMNLQYVIPEIELRGGAKPLPVKIVKYYPSLNCPHHLASFLDLWPYHEKINPISNIKSDKH